MLECVEPDRRVVTSRLGSRADNLCQFTDLWQMLRPIIERYGQTIENLLGMEWKIAVVGKDPQEASFLNPTAGEYITSAEVPGILAELDQIAVLCEEVCLTQAVKKIDRIRRELTAPSLHPGIDYPIRFRLIQFWADLRERIMDQASEKHFLYIPEEQAEWYDGAEAKCGPDAKRKLRPLWDDLAEACNCYATSNHNGSALLLDRTLEHAVRMFAKKLVIPLVDPRTPGKKRDWKTLIDLVHVNLKTRANSPQTGKTAKQLEVDSEIAALLDHARIAWRNAHMHPDRRVNAIDCKNLLEATVALTRALAGR